MDSKIRLDTKKPLYTGLLGCQRTSLDFIMVPEAGLEPARF
jgi:hypothetical protein